MKIDKKTLMPIVVLVSICVIVAALLGAVNLITAPEIEERAAEELREALDVVLPGANNFEEIELNENYPKEIKTAYKADKGFVFETYVKGKDFMTVICGIDNEGKIVKVDVLSESETPGYKEKAFSALIGDEGAYNGKDSASLTPELVSGATLTGNGLYSAVKASLDGYTVYNGGTVDGDGAEENPYVRADAELLSRAAALVPDSEGFDKLELEGENEYLVSLYKEKGGLGYVAYVLVISPNYGTPESEALIYIGNDAKVKDIDLITWKTSDALWGYVPPTAEQRDEFYERLSSVDYYSLYKTEPATNATNTSGRVLDSFNEAIIAVKECEKSPLPVILGIVVLVGSVGGFITLLIYNRRRRAPYEK